jgi:tetratricopeptide (TPR) repeat protein
MIDRKFAGQSLLQAELYGVVSQMFFNIANFEPAIAYGTRQVETLNSASADRLLTAKATLNLADILNEAGRYADAEVRMRRAIALAEGDAGMQVRGHAGIALAAMLGRNDLEAARAELDAADAVMASTRVPAMDRAAALSVRAESLGSSPGKARPLFDESIALALAAEGPMSRQAVSIRLTAAKELIRANQVDAGKSYLSAALTAMRASGGANDVNAALSEVRYTGMLFSREAIPFAEAFKTIERDRAALRAHNPPLPGWYFAQVEYRLGLLYVDWGDIEHGYPLIARAVRSPEWQVQGPVSDWWGLNSIVLAASRSDQVAEAELQAREMIAIGKRWQKADELQYSYYPLAAALMHARRYAEAEATLAEFDAMPGVASGLAKDSDAHVTPDEVRMLIPLERGDAKAVVEMTDHLKPKDGIHDDEVAWLARAAALCATGRTDAGLDLFAQWLPRLATDRYEASPNVAYWRARMGLCALQAGRKQQAREASVLATAAIVKQPGVSPHFKAPVVELEKLMKRS